MTVLILTITLLAAVLGPLFRQWLGKSKRPDSAAHALSIPQRYRPMLRLLGDEDVRFAGAFGNQRTARKLRKQRRQIFRGYLRNLRRDHALLCKQVRRMLVDSATDRRDIAVALFRSELRFRFLVVLANCKLACHAAGIGAVPVDGLLASFDQARGQFEGLLSVPQPAAA